MNKIHRMSVCNGPGMVSDAEGDYVYYEDHVESLQVVQWKPITPDSLPKAGDEVGGYDQGPFCEHVTAEEEVYTAAQWTDWGYRWHRPLGIPEG